MRRHWQPLLFVVFVLLSVTVTRISTTAQPGGAGTTADSKSLATTTLAETKNLSFQGAALANPALRFSKILTRKWEVLDPKVNVQGVLIQSLDDNIPLFRYQTRKIWPMASLAKLMTAIVILENIDLNKKIPISKEAMATEGEAGSLKSGEVYTTRDLVKILLLTSSNDAATAFEEYLGGREKFVREMNKKAEQLGMTQTIFHDASGLSDLNETSASDMARLVVFIIEQHSEILSWTRLSSILVQPINGMESKTLYNVNALASDADFLGGKTGTAPEALENLVALMSFHNYRVLVVILGSQNRDREMQNLMRWVEEAYAL